ncbi:PDZ domain-containing protein [Myxococcota bacterium]|nr:PDZ domain-containing protein [Myxococcota bacterium]MBU1898246.1 PDZ domain-containing protein [Myxococcota bacterium]
MTEVDKITPRHLWLIHLALLSVAAYESALLINHTLAAEIWARAVTRRASPRRAAPISTKGPPRGEMSSEIVARNLFNASPPQPVEPCRGPECVEVGGGEADQFISTRIPSPGEACKPSEVKLDLAGVMLAEPSTWSMAIFEGSEGDRMLREGQRIADYTLAAIQQRRVVLSQRGQFECLRLKTRLEKARARAGRRDPRRRGAGQKIKHLGQNRYEIDAGFLEGELKSKRHLKQARLRPARGRGRPQGVKLIGVQRGGLYGRLGLRSNDVIRAANDQEITKLAEASRLLERLRSQGRLVVEVTRRGRPLTFEYSVR